MQRDGKKYGMNFCAFQKKVTGEEKEVCSEWDDLILWEGYHYAYEEWKTNMRNWKSVRNNSKIIGQTNLD